MGKYKSGRFNQTDAVDLSKSGSGRINKTDAVDLRHMITIAVGTNGDTYPVHESLICSSSEFFRTARKPEWSAGKPQVVDLNDASTEIFEIYLHWLYFKTLPTVGVYKDIKCSEFDGLALCYVLGEMLMDKKFKDAVMDAMIDVLKQMKDMIVIPGSHTINAIYAGTTEGSFGRKLMVDIWATIAGEACQKNLRECHPEFILDLTIELLVFNNTKRPRPWTNSTKRYYGTSLKLDQLQGGDWLEFTPT